MDNNCETSSKSESSSLESPKPLAFVVDFGDGKSVDVEKQKAFAKKYEHRHKRGQSLSKLDDTTKSNMANKHSMNVNLPRKGSFQSEGYYSSDEKNDRCKIVRGGIKRSELTLPLKNINSEKINQSLPNIISPDVEIKDTSSPELDSVSPDDTNVSVTQNDPCVSTSFIKKEIICQHSSPQFETNSRFDNIDLSEANFISGTEFDFDKELDKSDSVSDAGTYTLDADNYSEEQKLRMSIDRDYKIERMSGIEKTQDYLRSLVSYQCKVQNSSLKSSNLCNLMKDFTCPSPTPPPVHNKLETKQFATKNINKLSPILSPTQNMSIVQNEINKTSDSCNNSFTKIMFPSEQCKANGLEQKSDRGSVISVTSSGAFRSNKDSEKTHVRKLSLTKSEIQVETYIDKKIVEKEKVNYARSNLSKLSSNIINVQNISIKSKDLEEEEENEKHNKYTTNFVQGTLVLGKISNLPPILGGPSGKNSPSKIPSPIHSISRPRSRNSLSSLNIDLSDSSIETESYLQPTQNFINSLQKKLSLDSDHDSDCDNKYELNNAPHNLLKQRTNHTRHNSLDDRTMKISNKLEHFQNKNLQSIDQTFSHKFNQYDKVIQKIQNSPNNSPIRRSSSFTLKNQINISNKSPNLHKESNLRISPLVSRNGSIQKSASSAYIKSGLQFKQPHSSFNMDHKRIDNSRFGDTESSSEEDFDKTLLKKKDMTTLTNTRYNRAFSLRRGRLDSDTQIPPKCPNTPEMRRKFPSDRGERAISVDRKPVKTEVQSRYMTNISRKNDIFQPKVETPKVPQKPASKTLTIKPQVFSRTDSGRFSMRSTKPSSAPVQRTSRKEVAGKKSGGRSNSSLTSKEVDFQNWKRRKSYDPMKAAAEGKKKELAKRQNIMTQSYNESTQIHDCDSSPSHSSSVHRSQSFHGTAAMEQQLSSDEDELTLSADEGFSPPTPSPCELSPARRSLRNMCRDHMLQ